MRLSRIAITLLVVALVAAFAVPGAIACDKTKTAHTENCDPASCTDMAACAAKGATASTASTTATAATATTAGVGCSKTASAASTTTVAGVGCSKTAAQTAGAGCSTATAKAAGYDVAIETVKLPSGALAVMYNGQDADTVAMLHSAANGSASEFGCGLVQKMTQAENCKVEMASTESGLIFLCTSDDAELIASFQKNYEIAQASPVEDEQGE